MRIDIEDVLKIEKGRKRVNSFPLEQIEWFKNNKPVTIDPKIIEEYSFTGLNNMDFIISDFYKGLVRCLKQ